MAIVKVMVSGTRKYVVNITGEYDVADEVDVVVIDRSSLIGPDGKNIPGKIRIDEITYAVGIGFDFVKLSWDNAANEDIEFLQGQGRMDYRSVSGKSPKDDPILAPYGDVLLTTSGGAAGDSYSILLNCSLKD